MKVITLFTARETAWYKIDRTFTFREQSMIYLKTDIHSSKKYEFGLGKPWVKLNTDSPISLYVENNKGRTVELHADFTIWDGHYASQLNSRPGRLPYSEPRYYGVGHWLYAKTEKGQVTLALYKIPYTYHDGKKAHVDGGIMELVPLEAGMTKDGVQYLLNRDKNDISIATLKSLKQEHSKQADRIERLVRPVVRRPTKKRQAAAPA